MSEFIYLASQSPRRRQLLEQLGVRHELLLPDADEDAESLEAVLRNEAPATYVQRVTGLKLDAAVARMKRRKLPPAPILCSDTTVAMGRVIYGKPDDAKDAARMLGELSGGTHRVLTAVAVQAGRRRFEALSTSRVSFDELTPAEIRSYVASGEPMGKAGAYAVQAGRRRFEALSTSRVSFDELTPAEIRSYVASGEPMGKAGAYAVQGRVAMHISRIDGSYSGIMGLPLRETALLLKAAGIRL